MLFRSRAPIERSRPQSCRTSFVVAMHNTWAAFSTSWSRMGASATTSRYGENTDDAAVVGSAMFYEAIGQMKKQLVQLETWLDAAVAHAAAKSFDPNLFLGFRLAPDQFAFVRQVD